MAATNKQNRFARLLNLRRRRDRNREINSNPEENEEIFQEDEQLQNSMDQQPPEIARAMTEGARRSQEVNEPSGVSDVTSNQARGEEGNKVNLPPPLSPVGPNGAAVNQPDQKNQIDQKRQLDAKKQEARGKIGKLKEKVSSKIDEFNEKMDATGREATEILKQSWLNLIPSLGLTLIWIHFHALLSKVFRGKVFRPLGSEWIPQEIIDKGGDELRAKIKKLGLIEWTVLLLVDFIVFIVLLIIVGLLGMLVYYYFNPIEALWDLGSEAAQLIWDLLWPS